MSWNGSGGFSRLMSWIADKAAGIDISSTRMDSDTNDIASNGFGNCLTRDGQGFATANLPMAAFRHTGVGNGVARTDYAALGQVEDGVINWAAAGGTADALTITLSPAVTSLVDGQVFYVRASAANATTMPTFTPNSGTITPHTITKQGGVALVAGDIPGNLAECAFRYNLANTRFELLNPATVATSQIQASAVTNAKLANMAAWTIKVNNTSGLAAPTDVTIDGLTSKATPLAADEVPIWDTAGTATKKAAFSSLTPIFSALRGYIAGLTLSGGGSQTLTINAGVATSDDNTTSMTLASNYTKTFSNWAVGSGNGALDTGSIATSTWYHVFAIERTDTSVVDVLISLSPTAPTLPANYTKQRRIGSIKTDGTPNIVSFFQNGDDFLWSTMPALDLNQTNLSTSAISVTLNGAPSGVRVNAMVNVSWSNNNGAALLLSSLDVADTAPSATASPLGTLIFGTVNEPEIGASARVWTNTSQGIRARVDNAGASSALRLQVTGWTDTRGRFN